MKIKSHIIFVSSLLVSSLFTFQHVAAATRSIDCNGLSNNQQERVLKRVIRRLHRGDTLNISGTCNVNLVIQEEVNDITLRGGGVATFNGPDPSQDVIRIEGRGIIVKGFKITGGRDGIHLHWGGIAQQRAEYGLKNNEIYNTGRHGIVVHANSSTRILNNVVHNNPGWGLWLHENASIRIGSRDYSSTPEGENVFEHNGEGGILVERSSTAHMVGIKVRYNSGPGIFVRSGAHSRIFYSGIRENSGGGVIVAASALLLEGNRINANSGNGVSVLNNAKVVLRGNSTSTANTGYAVACNTAGVLIGSLDTIVGDLGSVYLGIGCTEALSDYP